MENKKPKNKVRLVINVCIVMAVLSGLMFLYSKHQIIEKEMYLKKGLHIHQGMKLSSVLQQDLIKICEEQKSLEKFPVSNKKLGSKYVKSVTSNEKGEIRIEFAESIVKDGYLILVPKLNDERKLVWQCGDSNLDPEKVAIQCKLHLQSSVKTNRKESGE